MLVRKMTLSFIAFIFEHFLFLQLLQFIVVAAFTEYLSILGVSSVKIAKV